MPQGADRQPDPRPQIVREIVYRVLRGEQGGSLRALASRDDHFARIARVLKQIHADYATPLGAEEMARKAGMSVSAFHHNFKLVTACSPLQYLKRIRLDRARILMALDGHNASTRRPSRRLREPLPVQPRIQAPLRRHAHRRGREHANPARGRLMLRAAPEIENPRAEALRRPRSPRGSVSGPGSGAGRRGRRGCPRRA